MNTKFLRTLTLLLALVAVTLLPAVSQAGWQVDTAHSSIGFSVKHMAVSKTRGSFQAFDATFAFAPGKPDANRILPEIGS